MKILESEVATSMSEDLLATDSVAGELDEVSRDCELDTASSTKAVKPDSPVSMVEDPTSKPST